MTTFKTNKFGAKRGDFDYLYGEYNSLEEAKKALKWTAVIGQQFAVINEENKAELYLWQGRDEEPTKVGSGGVQSLNEIVGKKSYVEGDVDFEGITTVRKLEVFKDYKEEDTHRNIFQAYPLDNGYVMYGAVTFKSPSELTNNSYLGGGALYAMEKYPKSDHNTAVGSCSLFGLKGSGEGRNTAIGSYSGYRITTGNRNTVLGAYAGQNVTTGNLNSFIGAGSGAGITTGSGNTIIGIHNNLPATTTNSIILFDGNKRKGFEVDNSGKTTAPAQTNELIEADTTGKVIITKEYFEANIPTSNSGDIDRLSLFDQNNNEIGYNSLSTSSGTAKGDYSVALGRNSESTSNYSMVMGALNNSKHDYTQLLGTYLNSSKENQTIIGRGNATSDADIIIGIGEDGSNRKNALEVYSDGRIIAPSITNTLIDADTTGKAIITKEYLTPKMLISILTSATEAEKTQIKTLLGL